MYGLARDRSLNLPTNVLFFNLLSLSSLSKSDLGTVYGVNPFFEDVARYHRMLLA